MPSSGRAMMTMIQASLDAGSRWGRVSTRTRNPPSAKTSRTSAQSEREPKSASAQAHQVERAATEKAATLPSVAQYVIAPSAPIGSRFDVARFDAHRHAVRDVLRFLFTVLERAFDIARTKPAVPSHVDGVG